jgi:predicted transcriptional regulator
MTRKVVTVNKSLSIKELSKLFIENRFNGIIVRDYNDNFIGIVTQGDLIVQNMNLHIPPASLCSMRYCFWITKRNLNPM